MISYAPLMETLQKKGMDFPKLLALLGTNSGTLKDSLNSGRYLSLRTVDKLCKVLECNVQDICTYEEGVQKVVKRDFHCSIDWAKFENDLASKGHDLRTAGIEMNKSPSWLPNMKYRDSILIKSFKEICFVLELNYTDYVTKEYR